MVALIPGSPCKCAQEGLDDFGGHNGGETGEAEPDDLSAEWTQKVESCLNSTSFCSYFDRLWTRQEMMYARSIHVEWTHPEPPQCVKHTSWDNSNLFLGVWRTGAEGTTERPNRFEEMAKDNYQNLTPFACEIFKQAVSEALPIHMHWPE